MGGKNQLCIYCFFFLIVSCYYTELLLTKHENLLRNFSFCQNCFQYSCNLRVTSLISRSLGAQSGLLKCNINAYFDPIFMLK